MDTFDKVAYFLLVPLAIIACWIATTSNWKAAAVSHGAAHYVVNPQTGDTKFEWVTKAEGSK